MLHFIPVFYDMYAVNAEHFMAGRSDQIAAVWQNHFKTVKGYVDSENLTVRTELITAAVVSGVSAHIQGDMKAAIVYSYREHSKRYCGVDLLDLFKSDFLRSINEFSRRSN